MHRAVQDVRISRRSGGANKSASFCVFYQERAVARIDFAGKVFVRVDATLQAPGCEP
jgi:hypothetical protein